MQDTDGEVGTSSLVVYSYGRLHMVEQKQGDQLESTYSSSVSIRGVARRTFRKRWTIGIGDERESQGYLRWWHDKMMMMLVYFFWYQFITLFVLIFQ